MIVKWFGSLRSFNWFYWFYWLMFTVHYLLFTVILTPLPQFLFPLSSFLILNQSRHVTFDIHRFFFLNMGPLVSYIRNNSCILIEIVFPVFSPMIHKQIFFFVNQG